MTYRSAPAQLSRAALVALVCFLGTSREAWARQDVREAIVKIYTIRNVPDYYNPWSMRGPQGSTGSGCVIKGRKILTNAHIVSDQTFIQVRRYGESKRYQARVLEVSHAADLALLAVEDESFFEGVEPLDLGELPTSQQEVLVYGFPLGGDTLSITKGVISRVEHQTYSHSGVSFLAVQIDAAVNPGNSGGPALVGDRIVGVTMQGISQADNIGYIIPAPIIQHVLDDLADGRYDGFPSMGVVLQNMESPTLKKKYDMPEKTTGMLIVNVLPGAPADGQLMAGDVLLSVEDQPVADDGTIEFSPKERTSVSHLVQKKQLGESLSASVLRDGKTLPLSLLLNRPLEKDRLIPLDQYDVLPAYYIYGGVVFCPLTVNLLKAWGPNWYETAPKELVALLGANFPTPEQDEVVIVLKVLAADVNEGYHGMANWVVSQVDGEPIRNLKDLVGKVESGTGQFVVFENKLGNQVVLDREQVAEKKASLLATYRIPADRSVDLITATQPEQTAP